LPKGKTFVVRIRMIIPRKTGRRIRAAYKKTFLQGIYDSMKKLLIVLLILMTASVGLFAQLTPYGSVRLDFGGTTTLAERAAPTAANPAATESYAEGAWKLDALNGGTGFGLKGKVGDVSGDIHLALGGDIDAVGVWNAGGLVDVSAGYSWLPSAYWSSLAIWGNGNYGIGATAVGRASFIKLGAFGGYLGAAGQTGGGGGWTGVSSFLTRSNDTIPVIFAGYDYNADALSVGVSATFWSVKGGAWDGSLTNPDFDADSIPMLFTVHGKYDAGTFAVGGNIGFSVAPGAFGDAVYGSTLKDGPGASDIGYISTVASAMLGAPVTISSKKDMVLEAMLDFSVNLDPAVIAVTAGYIHNLAEAKKYGGGNALQIGACATLGLGNGFSLIPGVVYVNDLSNPSFNPSTYEGKTVDSKKSSISYGVSLAYSF
jgi:hypothetical protein